MSFFNGVHLDKTVDTTLEQQFSASTAFPPTYHRRRKQDMAIAFTSLQSVVPRCSSKPVAPRRVSMLHSCHRKPTTRSSSGSLIRCFSSRKSTLEVFEDQSSGVICYIDEGGQLICEGNDEGPRLSRFGSQKVGRLSWDMDSLDLLTQAPEHLGRGQPNEESLFQSANYRLLDFN